MANLTISNEDMGGVVIGNPIYEEGILKFPGADTYAIGTILGKKVVADAIADTPNGGNTGNGTLVSTVAADGITPIVGNYNFECTFAVTNGGVFKLEDPNGNIVADNLTLRVGDTLVTTFIAGGIKIVVTEGSTDFAAADKFELAVVADGDFVIFAVDGVGGAEIPIAILTIAETTTGADDVSFRPLISGQVRHEKLVIDAGGTVTDVIVDQLRDADIIAIPVTELNSQDNQ